ncbi:TPGS2 family protein [Megaselia abdita]
MSASQNQKLNSEDAFFENLTMGLTKTLANVPRITNINIEKRPPCEKAQIANWEQRHCVYLPEDMKKFYMSTDGFVFHWCYQYASNDSRKVGNINIPHLVQIILLRDNIDTSVLENSKQPNNGPNLTPKSKIFELNIVSEAAKVCFVYENSGVQNPKIYLLELSSFNSLTNVFSVKWQFLADSFSEYLRMAIAHLGLPYWELCFSSIGLPSWAEQLFLLLAPHLLDDPNNSTRRGKTIKSFTEHPYNTLDPNIFRVRPKTNKTNTKTK